MGPARCVLWTGWRTDVRSYFSKATRSCFCSDFLWHHDWPARLLTLEGCSSGAPQLVQFVFSMLTPRVCVAVELH